MPCYTSSTNTSTWTTPTTTATSTTNTRWYIFASTSSTPTRELGNEQAMRAQQARLTNNHERQAQDRARALLLEHLSPAQRKTFEENNWFVVEGGRTGRRYRVRAIPHLVANIDVLGDEDRVLHRLCGHCRLSEVPLADQLLAQKLMLQHDEGGFLLVANRHP